MPVVGPAYQSSPFQGSQGNPLGYPGYTVALPPGQSAQGGPIQPLQMAPGQFVPVPGGDLITSVSGPGMVGPGMPLGAPGIHGMTMHDQAEAARMAQDYEALVNIIKQWNANRLDLFALTLPNEVRNDFVVTHYMLHSRAE